MQSSRFTHVLAALLVAGVTLLIAVFYLLDGSRVFLDRRDRVLLDEFHQRGAKAQASREIVVLGIDEASMTLDTLWPEDIEQSSALKSMQAGWPWPRRVWAELIEKLMAAGAKGVFLDLAFKTPSADPEDDRLLAEVLKRYSGKVVLGAKFEEVFVGNVAQFNLVTPPPVLLEGNAGQYGLLSFWPDADDVVRRVDYGITRYEAEQRFSPGQAVEFPGEKEIPSVARLMAGLVGAESVERAKSRERIRFGEVDFYPPLSLHQVFVPELWLGNLKDGAVFKDRVVYVGATATEMQDFQLTPVGRMAGVQLHAHALAALLQGDFIQQASAVWRWLSLAAGGLLAWLLLVIVRQPVLNLLVTWGLSVLLGLLCLWLFNQWSLEASPIPMLLALNGGGMAGLMGKYWMQTRQTLRLRRSLARYTSPEFADELMKDSEGIYQSLGGVERTVTVLFSDVRGFTSMSENMEPAEIVRQLNEYLSRMVACVFHERGLVDKFIGDAVMALWGSLGLRKQDEASLRADALGAVRSAVAMRVALKELNVHWKAEGISELQFGIGIHQGPAVAGNIGSEAPYEKMDITVIGDSVNLASRLESVTKAYGVDLIISEEVQKRVADEYLCRRADLVKVKGKAKPVEVYSVVGSAGDSLPGMVAYEQGVTLYREGSFQQAIHLFNEAAAGGLNDRLTQMYVQRCGLLLESPPEDWDGVYVMKEK